MRIAVLGVGRMGLPIVRHLVAGGHEVVAVDPDALMLAELAARTPGVRTLVGSAETLPLADSSADAVVFGQSWHWVDPVAGSREAGRALRSGGVLGLIWNFVDVSEPWVAQFIDIMSASVAETLIAGGGPRIAAPFEAVETRTFPWTRELAAEQLAELATLVEAGPDREVDGVVRWRRVDLQRVIKERFDVDFHERYVGTLLKKLGFSHISARPRHPAQDARIVEAYKKTSKRR